MFSVWYSWKSSLIVSHRSNFVAPFFSLKIFLICSSPNALAHTIASLEIALGKNWRYLKPRWKCRASLKTVLSSASLLTRCYADADKAVAVLMKLIFANWSMDRSKERTLTPSSGFCYKKKFLTCIQLFLTIWIKHTQEYDSTWIKFHFNEILLSSISFDFLVYLLTLSGT